MPDRANATLVTDATAASALVADVRLRTRDLQLAAGLGMAGTPVEGAQIGGEQERRVRAQVSAHAGSADRRALAVEDLSAELCSAGSALVDVPDAVLERFVADPSATLRAGDVIAFSATHCTIAAPVDLGEVSIGDFGVGSSVNGRFSLQVITRSAADLVLEVTYSGFGWTPFGQAAFEPLDAVIRFGQQNGVNVYALELPEMRFLQAPQVVSVADRITVVDGLLRGRVPAAYGSGYADYRFTNWELSTTTGRASAGTVVVTGANGAMATVSCAAESCSVSFAVGGQVQQFVVTQ